ncbi:phage shock protein PspA [Pleionea sp. CnH1-48]|uniref:phage shock protein PspA n=1 Tax=Pleionea sp. CnH1-48 TaxID=2954494 RepID=UPI00209719C0|nr:phage shock protein PspA [Pleionea sp. CnH1-48]
MSIFSRFADIINSNLNALLDKAEDPEKLIRLIIQEMEDTLVEVRTMSAKTLAERKELTRKITWLEREAGEWQKKAELALSKSRDDLAKAALVEKHKVQQLADELSQQLKNVEISISHLNDEISQLQEKLKDARARQQSLLMRHKTAESRLKVKRTLAEMNTSNNALDKFEQFERKLDQVEGEVESFGLGNQARLNEEFAELEASEKVDEEMRSLKDKLNKND